MECQNKTKEEKKSKTLNCIREIKRKQFTILCFNKLRLMKSKANNKLRNHEKLNKKQITIKKLFLLKLMPMIIIIIVYSFCLAGTCTL